MVAFHQLSHHPAAMVVAARLLQLGMPARVHWQPTMPSPAVVVPGDGNAPHVVQVPTQASPEQASSTHPSSEAACSALAREQLHSPCYRHKTKLHVLLLSPTDVGDVLVSRATGCPSWLASNDTAAAASQPAAPSGQPWWCPDKVQVPSSPAVGGRPFHASWVPGRQPGHAPLLFVQMLVTPHRQHTSVLAFREPAASVAAAAARARAAMALSWAGDVWAHTGNLLVVDDRGVLADTVAVDYLALGAAGLLTLPATTEALPLPQLAQGNTAWRVQVLLLGSPTHPTSDLAASLQQQGLRVAQMDVDNVPGMEVLAAAIRADAVMVLPEENDEAALEAILPLLWAHDMYAMTWRRDGQREQLTASLC